MSADDQPHHRHLRFARVRRAKFWLRFMPRRARFHTYPIVGRFAAFARKRNYLWSFRYEQLRASFYAGSILALMPLYGLQLPLAFLVCLLFRTNFMILGGLQFITNPVTIAPVYFGTYKLGMWVMDSSGFGHSDAPATLPADQSLALPGTGLEPTSALDDEELHDPATGEPRWSSRFGTRINALILGGLITGALLGAVLDLLWRWLVLPAAKLHQARKKITAIVTAHDPTAPTVSSKSPDQTS
jgi:uncharacterized protein (DUF2062 family)